MKGEEVCAESRRRALGLARLAAGVEASTLKLIIDEQEAINAALDMANRGDLVLIFGDATSRCWKQIITYTPSETAAEASPVDDHVEASLLAELSTPRGLDIREFESLIIDERGARLAAENAD